MSVRFVAIVSPQSKPIYFKSAPDTPEQISLNHEFITEMSLDFIEKQGQRLNDKTNQLELLVIHDGITVYGMTDNTQTKYIIGVKSMKETPQLQELMGILSRAFVEYQINPFKKEGAIRSTAFDNKIKSIFDA